MQQRTHDKPLPTAVSASLGCLPMSVEGSGPPEARFLAASFTDQSLPGLSIVEIKRPLPVSAICNSSCKQQKAPAHGARQPAQRGWGEIFGRHHGKSGTARFWAWTLP